MKTSASTGLFGRLFVSSLWLVAAQVHALDVVKNTTATLRIVTAADTTKPSVSITAPAANASFAEGAAANVTGTAADNKGVLKVQYSLNSAAFADAATTVSSSGLSAGYTAALSLIPGVNTVAVKSIDTSNNESTVVSRNVSYNVIRPLTVNVTGSGTVPLPISTASYKVGFHYTLVAKPAAGQVFNGWTVNDATGTGITQAMLALPSLTFTHQQGLALTAAFIPNPFAVTGVVGGFNGLVSADVANSVAPGNDNSGFIMLTVTTAGSFTGTLKIDGLSLPLAGAFDNTGHALFGVGRADSVVIARPGKPSLSLSAVTLDLAPGGTHQITGILGEMYRGNVLPWSTLVAARAAFSTTSPVPSNYTVNKGYYTVMMPAQTQTNGLTSLDFPQGDGTGSLTVTTAGMVTLSATLADGAAVTASAPLSTVPLSNTLTCPLFAQLYAAKAGSFGGLITLDDSQPDHDLQGASFLWFKPYLGGQTYPFGWPEGVSTTLYGAKYASVPGDCVLPGLAVVVPPTVNAALTFSNGGLAGAVTKNLNLSPLNVVTRADRTDLSYTLTVTAATGRLAGTFTHTDGTMPVFNGIVFQKGANQGGYGWFLTVLPKVIDGTGESGGVRLHPAK